MKKILIFLLMLSTTNTFADCNTDFFKGIHSHEFASVYFQKGLNTYNRAVDLSRRARPNFNQICNLLVDSVTGFNVGETTFLSCGNDFENASDSCTGEYSTIAIENKKICLSNSDIAADNHRVLRTLLANSCFKKSFELKEVHLRFKKTQKINE